MRYYCKPWDWDHFVFDLFDWDNRALSWMCGANIEYQFCDNFS